MWPIIIYFVNKYSRDVSQTKYYLMIAIAFMIVVSVMLMKIYAEENESRSYMGTDTKIFEPLLGCLLAIMISYDRV